MVSIFPFEFSFGKFRGCCPPHLKHDPLRRHVWAKNSWPWHSSRVLRGNGGRNDSKAIWAMVMVSSLVKMRSNQEHALTWKKSNRKQIICILTGWKSPGLVSTPGCISSIYHTLDSQEKYGDRLGLNGQMAKRMPHSMLFLGHLDCQHHVSISPLTTTRKNGMLIAPNIPSAVI